MSEANIPLDQQAIVDHQPGSARFHSRNEAGEAVIRALPGIRCPMCQHDQFVLADRIDEKLRTRMNFYATKEALPKEGITTLSLICNNCGFVCAFEERILNRLAQSTEANGNG